MTADAPPTPPRGVVLFAYDDAIEPAREGAIHEKLLRAFPRDGAALDDDAVSSLIGFAIASRSIARGFGVDDESTSTSMSSFCVAKTANVRIATLELTREGVAAGARLDVKAFPDVMYTDRDISRVLERVKSTYLRALNDASASGDGGDDVVRDEAVREALERGVADFAQLGARVSENTSTTRTDGGEAPHACVPGAFESNTTLYAVEDVGNEGYALELQPARGDSASSAAAKSSSLDARTASTLTRLRRDVEQNGGDDAVKNVFVKPAHEAWVCASTSEGKRAYVVVEETSDTLLRAIRQAKTFAEAKFPALSNAYDVA